MKGKRAVCRSLVSAKREVSDNFCKTTTEDVFQFISDLVETLLNGICPNMFFLQYSSLIGCPSKKKVEVNFSFCSPLRCNKLLQPKPHIAVPKWGPSACKSALNPLNLVHPHAPNSVVPLCSKLWCDNRVSRNSWKKSPKQNTENTSVWVAFVGDVFLQRFGPRQLSIVHNQGSEM